MVPQKNEKNLQVCMRKAKTQDLWGHLSLVTTTTYCTILNSRTVLCGAVIFFYKKNKLGLLNFSQKFEA